MSSSPVTRSLSCRVRCTGPLSCKVACPDSTGRTDLGNGLGFLLLRLWGLPRLLCCILHPLSRLEESGGTPFAHMGCACQPLNAHLLALGFKLSVRFFQPLLALLGAVLFGGTGSAIDGSGVALSPLGT